MTDRLSGTAREHHSLPVHFVAQVAWPQPADGTGRRRVERISRSFSSSDGIELNIIPVENRLSAPLHASRPPNILELPFGAEAHHAILPYRVGVQISVNQSQ